VCMVVHSGTARVYAHQTIAQRNKFLHALGKSIIKFDCHVDWLGVWLIALQKYLFAMARG
jgi:hypothetical protein